MNRRGAFVRRFGAVLGVALVACLSPLSKPVEAAKSKGRAAAAAVRAKEKLSASLDKKGLAFGDAVHIRVFKEEAELELWMRPRDADEFKLLKTYAICAASGDLGPKQKTGDEQAPEGFYSVGSGALNPASSYHLSFDIGYPNAYDRSLGRTGSLIMIHGDCVSVGCFAMTDAGIEEIYSLTEAALSAGQPRVHVHAFPFRMTGKNMKAHAPSKWASFWENLKEGYDAFQKSRVPPVPTIKKGRYVF